jgi:hypothetical protein
MKLRSRELQYARFGPFRRLMRWATGRGAVTRVVGPPNEIMNADPEVMRAGGTADEILDVADDVRRAKPPPAGVGPEDFDGTGARRPKPFAGEQPKLNVVSEVDEAVDAVTVTASSLDDVVRSLRGLEGMTDLSDDVLRAIASDTRLAGFLESAPQASRQAIVAALKSSAEPEKVVATLSKVTSTDDGARVISVLQNEKAVVKIIADGGDVARLSKTAAALKVLQAAGVAADVFGIYVSVCEMMETHELMERTPAESRELKNLYRQRYGYHVAQIGVCGTGAVAGTMALVGVGGAATGPIAFVTLPVAAVLYAAYEGHKRREAKTRTEKDWAREYDLSTLIADARTYGFSERVGDAWELGGGWMMLNYPLMPLNMLKSPDRIQKFVEDMRSMNREMIEAMVLHTTTVSVPVKIREIKDGASIDREVNAEEKAFYQCCAKTYVDAKVQYLFGKQQDLAHAASSGANIADLLEESESYARLVHDRFVASEKGVQVPFPDSSKPREDQAQEYGGTLKTNEAEQLLASYVLQSALPGGEATSDLERAFTDILNRRSLPFHTYFSVRSQEGNYKDWWADGSAPQILSTHLMVESQKIIAEESKNLAAFTAGKVRALEKIGPSDQRTDLHRTVTEDLERALEDSTRKLEKHYISRSPREMWDALSDPWKEQIEEYIKHVSALQEIEKDLEEATYEVPFKDPEKIQTLRRGQAWHRVWLTQHPLTEVPAPASPPAVQESLRESDRPRYEVGVKLLQGRGAKRNPDSTFTYNADSNPKVTALYYRYIPGEGWQWSPDTENWMTVNRLDVNRGPFTGAKPSPLNQQFIDLLRQVSHPGRFR